MQKTVLRGNACSSHSEQTREQHRRSHFCSKQTLIAEYFFVKGRRRADNNVTKDFFLDETIFYKV